MLDGVREAGTGKVAFGRGETGKFRRFLPKTRNRKWQAPGRPESAFAYGKLRHKPVAAARYR